MIKEVFLWIEFILSLSWPLLFCWPFTLFGITAIGNKTVLFTCRFSQRKGKKFSLPEEFFILQDFLSLRLLFCCRMCYTIIGLQHQYAVIFIPSFNKDTHAFRQRKSALTASSRRRGLRFMSGRYSYGIGTPPTLRRSASPHEVLRPCGDPAAAYASMPASSSLSSSGFRAGENGVRGSAKRQAGWRLSTRRAMSGGIYTRKSRMCSCQSKVLK